VVILIKIFENLKEVFECYGEENIIPVTNIAQIIFYTSKYKLQPKWIDESSENKGRIVCYFHKGETKKAYGEWFRNRPIK
jgi:hypothetical protein